jgi:hypothetical protein
MEEEQLQLLLLISNNNPTWYLAHLGNSYNNQLIKRIIAILIAIAILCVLFIAKPVTAQMPVIEVEEKTWQEYFAELPIEMQNIAKCESNLVVNAKNPYSSASGIFQFINGTFAWVWTEVYGTPVDWTKKNDPFIQIELATWLYNKYGSSQWQYPCGSLV